MSSKQQQKAEYSTYLPLPKKKLYQKKKQITLGLRKGEEIRLPLGSGVVGSVATTGIPINISDAYSDHRFDSSVDSKTGYTTNSILAMPIRYSQGVDKPVIGVVQMINKISEAQTFSAFGPEDEELCNAISILVGVALHNALLYDREMKVNKHSFSNFLTIVCILLIQFKYVFFCCSLFVSLYLL